jgi:glycosyltransferase involved in cell wall biosynthesis
VYNGAATLRQALNSILAQDVVGLELLIVDDSSQDESGQIIEEYAACDARVTSIHNERNFGLAATLNRGLELAQHELVARMDQDDEALPGRLEHQLDFMRNHPSVAVVGTFVFAMGRTRRSDRLVRLPVTSREIARTLPVRNCLYHPTVMFRRSNVLAAGGYRHEFRNAEDYDLWLRLSKHHDLANIPLPLLRYRLSPGGMTLARRWEQQYYATLAQVAFREPTLTPADAAAQATTLLADIDRKRFTELVTRASVADLAALGLRADALRVLYAARRELSIRSLLSLARGAFRSGRRRASTEEPARFAPERDRPQPAVDLDSQSSVPSAER